MSGYHGFWKNKKKLKNGWTSMALQSKEFYEEQNLKIQQEPDGELIQFLGVMVRLDLAVNLLAGALGQKNG